MRQNIPVNQLVPGMKIMALDIGWDKSPKWAGPFVLDSGEDLALLLQHCKIVAVEKPGNEPQNTQVTNSTAANSGPAQRVPTASRLAESQPAAASPKKVSGEAELLRSRISQQFVIDSFHECLDVLNKNFERARQGLTLDAPSLQATSKKLLLSTIARPGTLALLSQLEEKDNTLERKSLDVAILSLAFGHSLGLPKAQLQKLGMAALLHDIGMIKIPDELLNQKEVLSIGQRISIQKHVHYSCEMLHQCMPLRPLTGIVAYHHERFDGTGYPSGLKGRKIPLEARILGITTTYEALTRNRHFSNKDTSTAALRKIYSWRNQHFDGNLVERFIRSIGVYPVGTLVELNKQQIGMVMDVTPQTRSRPKVRCLYSVSGGALPKARELDLASGQFSKVKITRTVEPEEIRSFNLQSLAEELGFSRVA